LKSGQNTTQDRSHLAKHTYGCSQAKQPYAFWKLGKQTYEALFANIEALSLETLRHCPWILRPGASL
jgi:hypothetical protein